MKQHSKFNRRYNLYLWTLPLLLLSTCTLKPETSEMKTTEPLSFHQSLLTIDSHLDTPLRIMREGIKLGERHDPYYFNSKLDFPRMDEGGLDAAFFAVWTAQGARTDSAHGAIKAYALEIISAVKDHIALYPDQAAMAYDPDDAQRLAAEGKHAIYMGMENGYPVGNDLNNVDLFYQQGIRYMTLCHTSNNDICDSSMDTTEFGGLSEFGYSVVERMNQLGMIVDISHVSDAAVADVLEVAKAPVIASHSCTQSLSNHARNLNDSLITAIARNGGVVQLVLFSEYLQEEVPNPARDSARAELKSKWGAIQDLDEPSKAQYRAERRELNRNFPRFLPPVSKAIDHLDHIVKLVGVDHVGIGSDFDGGGELIDCYDVSQFPSITQELLKRGYTESDIQKIWSGNFLRVFRQVKKIASTLSDDG